MVNWIPKALTILGVATALGGLSPSVYAQRSQTTQIEPAPSINNETAPETNSQGSNRPNLNLLAKTVVNFYKSDRYQTESEVQLNATTPGTTVASTVQVKTIAQSANQFRSEIAFTQVGSSEGKRFLIVSNGERVWIYRPDLKQYTDTNYQSFDKSFNSFFIGMSSYLFLKTAPSFNQLTSLGTVSNITEVLGQMLQASNVPIQGSKRSIQGKDYYVYEYSDPKQGYTFSGFVVPETATLEQLQISGKSEGMDLLLREKIMRRVENPAIAANTFSFSPPAGVTRVESLPLEPF